MELKLNNNNFIVSVNAPWDGGPLEKSASNITTFFAEDEPKAIQLLELFESKSKGIGYTSIRTNSKNTHLINALAKTGYSMTEIALEVSIPLSKIIIDDVLFPKFTFGEATLEDYKTISKYSTKYFNHGKFHEDPLIDKKLADIRNINMVKDTTKQYTTYLGKVNNSVIGFMILKISNGTVTLILGGMHEDYTHLAYPFWNRVFVECKNMNVKKITTTISAANIPIINLYSKFGFKFTQSFHGYRKFR